MIYNDDVIEKCEEAANDTLNSIVHVRLETKLNWSEHKHKQISFVLVFGLTSILKNLTENKMGSKYIQFFLVLFKKCLKRLTCI